MNDESDGKSAPGLAGVVAEFAQCMAFLTRLPLPGRLPFALPPLHQAMRQFPAVGALIGCVTGLTVCLGLALGLSSLVAATLGVTATVILTGALHEDGLADTADGFGGGKTADHKLAIMRDSRIGSYGVLALVFTILLKTQAIAAMTALPAWLVIASLAATGALSRALMVWLMRTSDLARSDGLAATAGQPSQAAMSYALATGLGPAVVVFWLASGWLACVYVPAAAFASAAIIRGFSKQQIGGYTGDVCGAVQAVTETVMLIAASSTLG